MALWKHWQNSQNSKTHEKVMRYIHSDHKTGNLTLFNDLVSKHVTQTGWRISAPKYTK